MINRISNSLVLKLYTYILIVLLLLFISLFILYKLVIPNIFLNKVIDSTTQKIAETELTSTSLDEDIFDLGLSTQTTSTAILRENYTDLLDANVYQIVIESDNGDLYNISVTSEFIKYSEISSDITVYAIKVPDSESYIAVYVEIDDVILQNRKFKNNPSSKNDSRLGDDFNEDNQITIVGTINDIIAPDSIIQNLIVTDEILKVVSNNYSNEGSENGIDYYFTSDDDSENIVFITSKTVDGSEYYLLSVYSLSNFTSLSSTITNLNTYIYIILFFIITFIMFGFSFQFSKPILKIKNKTTEIANLNFDSDPLTINGTDEISELSVSINKLSSNLQKTIYDLNLRNEQLSASIERENNNEKLKINFIQGMSHELKTPLAVILASAEAVETEVISDVDLKKQQLILIQDECKKMNTMIIDMLNVFSVDYTDYKNSFNPINISKLLPTIIKSMSPLAKQKDISIIYTIVENHVIGDEGKIQLVFTNLISNAIKYSPNKSQIEITTTKLNNQIKFSVHNTNSHIPENLINNIFEPFYRVDKSRSRNQGSTGLGLYIVNQILKQHDSECTVINTDTGVEFSFSLKCKKI